MKKKPAKLRNPFAAVAWKRKAGRHEDRRRKLDEKYARRDIDKALA